MKPHHLTSLFNPQSIAVIGASDSPASVGQIVLANLLSGQYLGKLYPVNLKHKMIGGVPAVNSVTKIKEPVDRCWLYRSFFKAIGRDSDGYFETTAD